MEIVPKTSRNCFKHRHKQKSKTERQKRDIQKERQKNRKTERQKDKRELNLMPKCLLNEENNLWQII